MHPQAARFAFGSAAEPPEDQHAHTLSLLGWGMAAAAAAAFALEECARKHMQHTFTGGGLQEEGRWCGRAADIWQQGGSAGSEGTARICRPGLPARACSSGDGRMPQAQDSPQDSPPSPFSRNLPELVSV